AEINLGKAGLSFSRCDNRHRNNPAAEAVSARARSTAPMPETAHHLQAVRQRGYCLATERRMRAPPVARRPAARLFYYARDRGERCGAAGKRRPKPGAVVRIVEAAGQ